MSRFVLVYFGDFLLVILCLFCLQHVSDLYTPCSIEESHVPFVSPAHPPQELPTQKE